MNGRQVSCHDGLPVDQKALVYFRHFADRLPGVTSHALLGMVRAGRFPVPAVWRGMSGQPGWRPADVEAALAARRVVLVATYDGEPAGAHGDP